MVHCHPQYLPNMQVIYLHLTRLCGFKCAWGGNCYSGWRCRGGNHSPIRWSNVSYPKIRNKIKIKIEVLDYLLCYLSLFYSSDNIQWNSDPNPPISITPFKGYSHPHGPSFALPTSILTLFTLVFKGELVDTIVEETNRYACKKNMRHGKK